MRNVRLIYASVGLTSLDATALTSILRLALPANRKVGISGILCSGDGVLLQALEGERSAVNRLYVKIVQDPRHTDCEVVACSDIETRSFTPWSMRLVSLDDLPTVDRRQLLTKHLGVPSLEKKNLGEASAFALLCDLANRERAALSPLAQLTSHQVVAR